MTDRSLRVVLSASASSYISEMSRAAEATKKIAVEAIAVRTRVAEISKEAEQLAARFRSLSTAGNLTDLTHQVTKMGEAVRGLSGLSALSTLARDLRELGTVGGSLTVSTEAMRKLATAMAAIGRATTNPAALRDFATAMHGLRSIGGSGSAEEVTKLAAGIRRLVSTANSIPAIRALATALRDLGAAGGALGGLGNVGNSLRGMQGQIDQLQRSIARLRGSSGGGGGGGGSGSSGGLFGSILGGNLVSNALQNSVYQLGSALKSTFKQTADYETEIQTFGAVLKATPEQLQQVSAKALALGADFTIAGASASDAAVTMTELGKGGLSIQGAMDAAKGSLQLASAGSVSFTSAAEIMTSALASFQLDAKQASVVTDDLANTANAARGNISDFAEGIKYAGTVAHQAGYSLQTTSAVLAVFAQNGLTGSVGGTVFKEMILKLENASGKAKTAIRELGISTYDANGNFITATHLADQLAEAKKRMSKADFNAATATVFGARAIQGASIFAASGGAAIEKMSNTIQSGAGAAAFSAARMKGLGGAFANLQNQVQTAQVQLGEKFSASLQSVMNRVSDAIPIVSGFLTGAAFGGGISAVGSWFDPIVKGAGELVSAALPYITNFIGSMKSAFGSVVAFIKPVADGIGMFFHNLASGGAISTIGSALDGLGHGFANLLKFVAPVGEVIGGLVGWLGKLPTPIIAGATALGLFLLLRGPMIGMLTGLSTAVQFLGGSLERTFAVGILSSLKAFGSGILSAFGGPVGLAITAVTVGLALFMGRTKDATIATHDFTGVIDENTGALVGNANQLAAQQLKDTLVIYKDAGGNVKDYTDAVLGNGDAQKRVAAQMASMGAAAIEGTDNWKKYGAQYTKVGITSSLVADALGNGGTALQKLKTLYAEGGLQKSIGDFSYGIGSLGGNLSKTSDIQKQYAADMASFTGAVKAGKVAAEAAAGSLTSLNQGERDASDGAAAAAKAAADQLAITKARIAQMAGLSVNELSNVAHGADILTANFNIFANTVDGIKVSIDSKGIQTFSTDSSDAFAKFKQDATDAQGAADLFWFKMAGPAATVTQAINAAAAAMRAVGAAQRDIGANNDAVTTAQTGLSTAMAKPTSAATSTSSGYSEAQKILDVAAARRTLAAAMDTQRGSGAALFTAEVAAGQAAAGQVESTYKATLGTQGYAKAVAAATAQMTAQRGAYIANYIAGAQASMSDKEKASSLGAVTAAAKKSADAMGLIPRKVETIIDADPSALIAKAAAAKLAADLAAKARTLKLTADTKDALRDIGVYRISLGTMPAAVRTKFNADIATAKANGQNLYNVYNRTTGQWVAQFLTPTAAAAKQKAGDLVRQYDRNRGTWTANLVAVNLASSQIDAVAASLAAIKDKTVTLSVNAAGGVRTIQADGSFAAGTNQVGKATGGMVFGPGSGTSDSIPVWLSHGEGVNTAAAMSKAPNRKAMEFMNSGGTIPGFAVGGLVGSKTNINLMESGNIDPALAHIKALFGNTDKSVVAANAASAAAAALTAAIPIANGGGTEQWRALALSVAAAKGENPASVQVMLNQMSRESSGNPAAINLTDSNALAGHPSVGLLQFIPGTFNAYADPGFNTNIYDPASQMHAWYNYINAVYGGYVSFGARGYGAYANGGLISGSGSGTSDSILARVSNGEGINTASAMSKPENRNAMHYMNAGGTMPGFAAGGIIQNPYPKPPKPRHGPPSYTNPSGPTPPHSGSTHLYHPPTHTVTVHPQANGRSTPPPINANALWGIIHQLAGNPAPSYSPGGEETAVLAAVTLLAGEVTKIRATATGKAALDTTATQKLKDTEAKLAINVAAAEAKLKAAEVAAGVSVSTSAKLSQIQLTKTATSTASTVTAAEERLRVAEASSGKGTPRAIASAQIALEKARANAASAMSAIESRIAVLQSSKSMSAGAKVEAAQLQLAKVEALGKIGVDSATRAYDAAHKVAAAYAVSAAASEKYFASQQAMLLRQQQMAAQVDALTLKLGNAQSNVATAQANRASASSGFSSTIQGFDGGITGHPDTRNTAATILAGSNYDVAQAEKFYVNLAKLKKAGLNSTSLSQIASAGIDGGGVTAAALANQSATSINHLNISQARLRNYSNATGDLVAGSMYDAGIRVGQGLVTGIMSQIKNIEKAMTTVAKTVTGTLVTKLKIHSPSLVMHEHGMNIATGLAQGILSGTTGVTSAVNGMVQLPQPMYMHPGGGWAGQGGGGSHSVNVRVFVGNQEITDIARVEVENGFTQFKQASLKLAGQPV